MRSVYFKGGKKSGKHDVPVIFFEVNILDLLLGSDMLLQVRLQATFYNPAVQIMKLKLFCKKFLITSA